MTTRNYIKAASSYLRYSQPTCTTDPSNLFLAAIYPGRLNKSLQVIWSPRQIVLLSHVLHIGPQPSNMVVGTICLLILRVQRQRNVLSLLKFRRALPHVASPWVKNLHQSLVFPEMKDIPAKLLPSEMPCSLCPMRRLRNFNQAHPHEG